MELQEASFASPTVNHMFTFSWCVARQVWFEIRYCKGLVTNSITRGWRSSIRRGSTQLAHKRAVVHASMAYGGLAVNDLDLINTALGTELLW